MQRRAVYFAAGDIQDSPGDCAGGGQAAALQGVGGQGEPPAGGAGAHQPVPAGAPDGARPSSQATGCQR